MSKTTYGGTKAFLESRKPGLGTKAFLESRNPGLCFNFGKFPCSWLQILIRFPYLDPGLEQTYLCGSTTLEKRHVSAVSVPIS
jgi:hypothetical protein